MTTCAQLQGVEVAGRGGVRAVQVGGGGVGAGQ